MSFRKTNEEVFNEEVRASGSGYMWNFYFFLYMHVMLQKHRSLNTCMSVH